MMHCNERVSYAMRIAIWVPIGIAMLHQSLIKNISHPSRVGRVLMWAHSNVTFLYLLHHWTFTYTLNLLLRGIEPTVARVKGGDITTTLKGLLLEVLCHVHTTPLSAFLGLRDFFYTSVYGRLLPFILGHKESGLNSEMNEVWLYLHRLCIHF